MTILPAETIAASSESVTVDRIFPFSVDALIKTGKVISRRVTVTSDINSLYS
jgi:hypothetical protein